MRLNFGDEGIRMLNLKTVGLGPSVGPAERPIDSKELDGIVRALDREAAEDQARGPDQALRGAGRHVLMARRGVMSHGPFRTPGPAPTLALAPTLAGTVLRAAVATSPPVRAAADRLVDCLTQPTGLKGLWRRLLSKEKPVPLHKQASRLVDAVHQSVMQHRGAATPVAFEEGKILHELVREGFQRLDVPAQTRWRDRVTGGAGEFARARRAQTSTADGLFVDPRAGSPHQRACAVSDLLFDMKAVAYPRPAVPARDDAASAPAPHGPDSMTVPSGPVIVRPPLAAPPKPPRQRAPEEVGEDEKKALLAPHAHAIGLLKANIAKRPHWTDRLPWRSAKLKSERQNEISTLTREIGKSMVEALMQRGKSADAACLVVESWCVDKFDEIYRASDRRERQQWARNVSANASGAFAAARREYRKTFRDTGYEWGDIRPGKAADVATGYVMLALEQAAFRGRGAAIAA
jgi:hypothetical protein